MAKRRSGSDDSTYARVLEMVFQANYQEGLAEFYYATSEYHRVARELGVVVNVADIPYTFRNRREMPESIRQTAPAGMEWHICLAGRGRHCFRLEAPSSITPNPLMLQIKIPDATPGMIARYSLNDEQALLARIRYNRLIDIFTGVACYSLQNHLKTQVAGVGQLETDELYVGISKGGTQYVFPVEAKGENETLGSHQIDQGYKLCAAKFPDLVCRPIGAQFAADGVVALFELAPEDDRYVITSERHYRLVPPRELTSEELLGYRHHEE